MDSWINYLSIRAVLVHSMGKGNTGNGIWKGVVVIEVVVVMYVVIDGWDSYWVGRGLQRPKPDWTEPG